ncbi:MAG: nuclear transport factor 2 family protein [Acidimicrobiia bacterium]|nr:nuclear transport factor 2 family protein [Acidimicrobiia bacterium]
MEQYYSLVDSQDFDQMLRLFHPDIHYQRGDLEIEGIARLQEFYLRQRTIRSGRHTIVALIEDDPWVVTRGRLDGVLDSGEKVSVEFADFHQFQTDLIWRRFTYFRNRAV